MRILCVGGGPAGLYFALLHKTAHPRDTVVVVEQNRADATYGWGVVFSDKALTFLQDGDARFMADLIGRLECWDDLTIVHRGDTIQLDGHRLTAIARLELLRLLRSVHFSIGSGTRLALEDAIALHRAVEDTGTAGGALETFERARRPIVEKIAAAAARSSDWYEQFHERMSLPPLELAMSYATRTGRISRAQLEQVSPRFMSRYDRWVADAASPEPHRPLA